MLEIEMKFRVDDPSAYERKLNEEYGVAFGESELEMDVFFTNEALGFPNEGKALRIRRRGDYLATTFKGPKLDRETKTREEIELPLAANSGADVDQVKDDWIKFYNRLGFRAAAVVEKTRRRARAIYSSREFEITLDRVEGIGVFTELETTAPSEEFESARASVVAFAKELGLRDTIVKSYLALVEEARTGKKIEEK